MSQREFITNYPIERLTSLAAALLCALLLSTSAAAQCPNDDDAGSNDNCANAIGLPVGPAVYAGVTKDSDLNGAGAGPGDDWFFVNVAPGNTISMTLVFDHSQGNIDVDVRASACGAPALTSNISSASFPAEVIDATNNTPNTISIFFRVFMNTPGGCNNWTMFISDSVCTPNGASEPNDSCAGAISVTNGAVNSLLGLTVESTNEDWYQVSMPPFTALVATLTSEPGQGNANISLSTSCGATQDASSAFVAQESVQFINDTSSTVSTDMRVFLSTGGCVEYDLAWAVLPCAALADAFEPNDLCSSPTQLPGASSVQVDDLLVTDLAGDGAAPDAGDDWFEYTIPVDHKLTVDATFSHAVANIDILLFLDCGVNNIAVSNSGTDNEHLEYINSSGLPQTVQLRTFVSSVGGCGGYSLTLAATAVPCLAGADDAFEPNNSCGQTLARPANSIAAGLNVSAGDLDLFSIEVPPGVTQTFEIQFSHAEGDLYMIVTDGICNTTVGIGDTQTDNETVVVTNNTGATKTYGIQVGIFPLTTGPCAPYALSLSNDEMPMNLTSSCNGDGGDQVGCTDCPCTNNAPVGSVGGCLNSAGTSARLVPSGSTSVSLPSGDSTDLRFGADGVPPGAFCILNSGDALAPGNMANPCFGTNSGGLSVAFDGLRCAITNTRRHGGRSADSNGDVGVTNNPWGGEGGPTVGLAVAGGGFISGATRHFQIINRDDALLSCMRGLNTSQAVEVTFTP